MTSDPQLAVNLYASKSQQYYTNVRTDLVSLLPASPTLKVLEVGAGGGDTLVYIKAQKLASEVVGIDIFDLPDTNQRNPLIDRFIIVDIEKDALDYAPGYFDVILCGDVIEHLVDPWATIKKLATYLKKDGLLVISTPNFRHLYNFITIFLQGDFKYNPAGDLLDRTHLRFFCKKNIEELVRTEEFAFQSIAPIIAFKDYKPRFFVRFFNAVTGRLFEQFIVSQYVVVGRRR
ncbi:class I SAM-dependent methyltransferase [Spirosoma agri]|uniref:Class I SAM-dependent methyltransferase n=1 Tax=Spirosoma agri TaxID=1987381 RepID=A0A6M0ID33_9BACT|nr:class I SAM-dependent methyltransferase [Spirosoma agri]NEU65592.1 class I SAM-dependent methyltransferase [Spirosoma agri]